MTKRPQKTGLVFLDRRSAPPEMVAQVDAAVAADPAHTMSLLGFNPDGAERAHGWLVYEAEQKVTDIMLAAALIAWRNAWKKSPQAPLREVMRRCIAEALLQMASSHHD